MDLAKKIKQEIKPGDIILSFNRKNLVSRTIAQITNSDFSHCFIYIGYGKILDARFDGYKIRDLDYYLNYGKYNLSLRRPYSDPGTASQFVEASKQLRGVRYGFFQLLYLGFLHLIGLRKDTFLQVDLPGMTCSESAALAMQNMGFYPFGRKIPSHITPQDIAECSFIITIL